jgi:putative transposase
LADAISYAKIKHKFDVWAYVFMPEHVHLLILPNEDKYDISKILQSIKQSVSRRAVRYAKESNPRFLESMHTGQKGKRFRFWMAGGGYDRNIYNRDVLLKVIRYIHRNPIRRELVKNPGQWKWSSIHYWLGIDKNPIEIDLRRFPVS